MVSLLFFSFQVFEFVKTGEATLFQRTISAGLYLKVRLLRVSAGLASDRASALNLLISFTLLVKKIALSQGPVGAFGSLDLDRSHVLKHLADFLPRLVAVLTALQRVVVGHLPLV